MPRPETALPHHRRPCRHTNRTKACDTSRSSSRRYIDNPRRSIRGAEPEARRARASRHGRVAFVRYFWLYGSSRFRGRAAVLCLFDKATRPRHRPRRTRLRSCLPGYRGAARSGRARGYYAHGVRDVIRSQARVRVPICIPVLDISYTERRQVPRHWEERRAELGGPVHDPRLRATHRARATGTRMPVEDECHRRSW